MPHTAHGKDQSPSARPPSPPAAPHTAQGVLAPFPAQGLGTGTWPVEGGERKAQRAYGGHSLFEELLTWGSVTYQIFESQCRAAEERVSPFGREDLVFLA